MSSVKDFGASGNGVKDDTAAVRRAIEEGDGVLDFPAGDYRITDTLRIDLSGRMRRAVRGSGGAARLIMAAPGPAISIFGTHAGSADPRGLKGDARLYERMPAVKDIEIEGAHPEADGIFLEGVMQPVLSGLLIREVNTAVRIHKRARNVLIDGCHIYHNRNAGIHLDRVNLHQVNITGSHISYCRLGGIRVEGSEIRNLQITGNDIEYNNERTHGNTGGGERTADIFIDASAGVVREGAVTGNTIQATPGPGGANILFSGRGPGESLDVGLFSVTGNLIGSQENNIVITNGCGIAVTGNTVYGCRDRNILVENSRNIVLSNNIFNHPAYRREEFSGCGISLSGSVNCNISGSIVQDCGISGREGRNRRRALIEAVRCRSLNITGTQVLDGFPYGILLEDCADSIISSNIIIDGRKRKRMRAPVSFLGACYGNMFVSNRAGQEDNGSENVPGGF